MFLKTEYRSRQHMKNQNERHPVFISPIKHAKLLQERL